MSLSNENLLRIVANEAFKYRNAITSIFVVVSLTTLGVGTIWPKKYTSSTSILVNESNIIDPLMAGRAVATSVRDRSSIVHEIIFRKKVMDQILAAGGWMDNEIDEIEQQQLIELIKKRTNIDGDSENLLKIEYADSDPERAYVVTKTYSDIFITESLLAKANESKSAYEFINNQVLDYQRKLTDVEGNLEKYRIENDDINTGSAEAATGRINSLLANIEQTTLQLKEAEIRQTSIEKQLSGEAESTLSFSRQGQLGVRIGELQTELDRLRLSYVDTYPDIIAIKEQIKALKIRVEQEKDNRIQAKRDAKKGGKLYIDEGISTSPLFQTLRTQLSEAKTQVETLAGRLTEIRSMLRQEMEMSKRLHSGEKAVTELTRDYQVNREIYQDLLRRRENARVSMDLNRSQQDQTFKIQEPAFVPLRPSGFRFLHFVIGGIFLGTAIPLGLIYLLVTMDPRIRDESQIASTFKIPVMGMVTHLVGPAESGAVISNLRTITLVIACTVIIYVSIVITKVSGILV